MKKTAFFISLLILMLLFAGGAYAESFIYSSSVSGTLTMHLSPEDDSFVTAEIPSCAKLKLLDKKRTWGLVEYMNRAGWINLSFTYGSYEDAAETTGNDFVESVKIKTKEGKASLYNIPSADEKMGSSEKYQVPDDTILKITRKTDSGWGLVSMNGQYAWVQMEKTALMKEENGADNEGIYYVYVLSENSNGLELWNNSEKETLLAVIPDCTKLTVREEKDGFAYVSHNGINGWIEKKFTAGSLVNAQLNSGTQVNKEYVVSLEEETDAAQVYRVPSKENDENIVAEIKEGEYVFVLRSNLSGWSLVNLEGKIGWIPPGNLAEVEEQEDEQDFLTVLKTEKKGFVATHNGRGVKVYADDSDKNEIATLPECTQVRVVAKKGGYEYIISEYASGWTKGIPLTETYKESLEKYPVEKKMFYVTNKETLLMNLPAENPLYGVKEVSKISKGEYLEVLKTAVTEKDKWVLTEIDSKTGWIKMTDIEKVKISGMAVLVFIAQGSAVLAFIAFVVYVIRKTKRKMKKNKSKKRKGEKNAEGVQFENSGSGEKLADVPGKR